MAPTWQTVPEDTLRIRHTSHGWIVRVIGMVLLLIGAEPSTSFVRALIHVLGSLTYDGDHLLLGKVIGLTILLLFAAVFVVPGLLLTFAGTQVEIDPTGRTIRVIGDYVLWRATEHYDFAEIASVSGRAEKLGRLRERYRLDLMVKDGSYVRRVFTARSDSKDVTRILGDIMSEKIGVQFENLT